MNHTLQGDDETRRRRLRIRTYKIVPTTPQTGVIEWVIGAQAFGAYLTTEGGVGGAHGRYYPTDWSTKQCRDHLTEKVNANNEKVRPALRSFLSLPPLLSPSLSPSLQHPRLFKGPALLGPRAAGAPAGDLPELPPRLPLLLFGEVPGPHTLGELPPGLHAQVRPIYCRPPSVSLARPLSVSLTVRPTRAASPSTPSWATSWASATATRRCAYLPVSRPCAIPI